MSSLDALDAYERLRSAAFDQILARHRLHTANCEDECERAHRQERDAQERVTAAIHDLEELDA